MDEIDVEILVEPFREGAPGAHVQAALDALADAGLEVEMGPFASTVSGEVEVVADALRDLVARAIREGATRINLQIVRAAP